MLNLVCLGAMPMPADFRHADLLRRGRPLHRRFDDFSLRHPAMDPGRRAKIFAPFDALAGFSDAIAAEERHSMGTPPAVITGRSFPCSTERASSNAYAQVDSTM